MNTHVSPDDLSFLKRYREIRAAFAPPTKIPMRVVDQQAAPKVIATKIDARNVSTEASAPSSERAQTAEPAKETEKPELITIEHPVVDGALKAVSRAIDIPVGVMLFEDTELAIAARQVVIVYLTEGAKLPANEVEALFGMVPGTARQAFAVLADRMRKRAVSFSAGPYAIAKVLLSDDIPRIRGIGVVDCMRVAAKVGGVAIDELRSNIRSNHVAKVRQVGMWLARTFSLASLPEIGRRFGGRDHTTVLHAVRKIEPIAERLRPRLPPGATLEQWAEALLADDRPDAGGRAR